MEDYVLQVALWLVSMWWIFKLSRDVLNSLERKDEFLDTLNPVYSRKTLMEANAHALLCSAEALPLQRGFDAAFEKARRATLEPQGEKPSPVPFPPQPLLELIEPLSEAAAQGHLAWCEHSIMLNANVAVVTGKLSRDEALSHAEAQLALWDSFRRRLLLKRELAAEIQAHLRGKEHKPDPETVPFRNRWFERTQET